MKRKSLLATSIAILALTVNTMAQPVPAYVPTNGLKGWWGFNGNANDESGNGNNGTTSNVAATTDRFGTANAAYSYNGINSRIDVANAFFDVGWPQFTISCWMNSNNANNSNNVNYSQPLINTVKHNGIVIVTYGTNNPFSNYYDDKYVVLAGTNPDVRDWNIIGAPGASNSHGESNGYRTLNQWNHVVLVKNSTNFYLYLNGILDKTYPVTITAPSHLCKLVFGALDPAITPEVFSGKLDDYGVWNRALTQQEITALYQSCNISTPTSISVSGGSAKVCAGDTRIYTTAQATGVTYNWTVPTGAVINSGQGTRSINVTYNNNFTAIGVITVVKVNSCGSSAPRNLTVNKNIPTTPSNITGPNFGLCGGHNIIYSVQPVQGMTYNWTVPGLAHIVSGQGTNTITVNFQKVNFAKTISVTANNYCGTSATRSLIIRSAPQKPGAISGNANVCSNSTGNAYSIVPVASATYYIWTGPTGSHLTANGITSVNNVLNITSNTVTIDFGTITGTSRISVKAGNTCGSSTYSYLYLTNCVGIFNCSINKVDNTVCNPNCNGTATVIPANGTAPYTYEWSNSDGVMPQATQTLTGMCGDNYTVIVTDNNGNTTSCNTHLGGGTVFTLPTYMDVNFMPSTNCSPFCNGFIDVDAWPTQNYTYLWSNGETTKLISGLCGYPEEDGNFTVTVTDVAGCTQMATYSTFMILQPFAFWIYTTNETSPGASDGQVEFDWLWVGGGIETIEWSDGLSHYNGGNFTAGNYSVIVTDVEHCSITKYFTIGLDNICDPYHNFTTYTQDEWVNNSSADQLLNNSFENCFDTIVIGDPCGYTVKLTNVAAIQSFLPQTATPAALTQNYTDPVAVNLSELAGQLLGVGLELSFDPCLNYYIPEEYFGDQIYIKTNSPFYGWSIRAIYDTASKVVSGCPSNYTPAQVNEACKDVNENYDQGGDNGLFTCPYDFNHARIQQAIAAEPAKKIKAYPNPFSGVLNIDVITDEGLIVTMMDITGRIINEYHNINSSFVIDTHLNNGLYFIKVENESGSYKQVLKVVRSN